MMRGKPVGSHCKMGSLPSGTALVPYQGRSVANLACAQGVIGGISFFVAVLSAPPLPWYNQTPDMSRLGAGAAVSVAAFACGADRAEVANAKASTASPIVGEIRRLLILTSDPFSGYGRRQKRFSPSSLQRIRRVLRSWPGSALQQCGLRA